MTANDFVRKVYKAAITARTLKTSFEREYPIGDLILDAGKLIDQEAKQSGQVNHPADDSAEPE